MIEIDCGELTADEQLALAGALNEAMGASGVAFVRDRSIVFDSLVDTQPDKEKVLSVVAAFVSRRKDAAHYSVETKGERVVVHSPDPIAGKRSRRMKTLPPNLYKCPFSSCGFVTPYEEAYVVHYRSHGFVS